MPDVWMYLSWTGSWVLRGRLAACGGAGGLRGVHGTRVMRERLWSWKRKYYNGSNESKSITDTSATTILNLPSLCFFPLTIHPLLRSWWSFSLARILGPRGTQRLWVPSWTQHPRSTLQHWIHLANRIHLSPTLNVLDFSLGSIQKQLEVCMYVPVQDNGSWLGWPGYTAHKVEGTERPPEEDRLLMQRPES